MNREMEKFMRELARWQGVASSAELSYLPQRYSVRQACKRKGLVTFNDGYWRLTDAGRTTLRTLRTAP